MNRSDSGKSILSKETIRHALRVRIRGQNWLSIFLLLFLIPFEAIGISSVSHGDIKGLFFIILPALLVGAFLYLTRRQASMLAKRLEGFEQGSFELKRMKLESLDKKTHRDSDGDTQTTYYIILREENGSGSARFTVSRQEYDLAEIGDMYFVLFVQNSAVLPFSERSYTPDAELQALLDCQTIPTDRAAAESESFSDAAEDWSFPTEPAPYARDELLTQSRVRTAFWLDRALMVFLLLFGVAGLSLFLQLARLRPRFAAMASGEKALLVVAAFVLLWGVFLTLFLTRRNCLQKAKLRIETDEALIRELTRNGKIITTLFSVVHIAFFFLLSYYMK